MSVLPALCFLTLAAAAPQAVSPPAGTISRLSEELAGEVARHTSPDASALGVFVTAAPDELGNAFQTSLVARLVARHFKTVVVVRASDSNAAEAKAREAGLDFLLRLQVLFQSGDLTASGDLVPTWANFWAPAGARGPGGTALAVRLAADSETLTLARAQMPHPQQVQAAPLHLGVRLLARIPQRVIAMVAGDLDGDGKSELALLTPDAVVVARADGTVLARADFARSPAAARPPRHLAGTIAIQRTATGPVISYWDFGRAHGETLAFDGRSLRSLGETDLVPACAGGNGVLVGTLVAGKGLIEHVAHVNAAAHFLPEPVSAVAAAVKPGSSPAFLAMLPNGSVQVLGADLSAMGAPITNAGLGSVLADLDGDGQPEMVLTLGAPVAEDRVRAFRIGRGTLAPLDLANDQVSGAVFAGAAGDFDGSGREAAVVAAVSGDGTALYRVGAEP
jgi:hypothetical protein